MKKQDKIIPMNDIFDENEAVKYMKSYMFIKGFAFGKGLRQTILSLAVARRLHEGQYRKDGTPYISHPLKVCTTLISYGIEDDVTLSAALLHDVFGRTARKSFPWRGASWCWNTDWIRRFWRLSGF